MPSPPNEDSVPQPAGIIERLVRDDVDRKRFLKMASKSPTPNGAFDKPLTEQQVLTAIKPLIKS